MNYTI